MSGNLNAGGSGGGGSFDSGSDGDTDYTEPEHDTTSDPNPTPFDPTNGGSSGGSTGGVSGPDVGITPGSPSGDGDVAHSEPVTSPEEANQNQARRDQANSDNDGRTVAQEAADDLVFHRVQDYSLVAGAVLLVGLVLSGVVALVGGD